MIVDIKKKTKQKNHHAAILINCIWKT